MGIASVMSTLLSLSMTTSATIIWRNSLRCSGVSASRPWPTFLAHVRTVSISRRFSVPLASRAGNRPASPWRSQAAR